MAVRYWRANFGNLVLYVLLWRAVEGDKACQGAQRASSVPVHAAIETPLEAPPFPAWLHHFVVLCNYLLEGLYQTRNARNTSAVFPATFAPWLLLERAVGRLPVLHAFLETNDDVAALACKYSMILVFKGPSIQNLHVCPFMRSSSSDPPSRHGTCSATVILFLQWLVDLGAKQRQSVHSRAVADTWTCHKQGCGPNWSIATGYPQQVL